MMRKDLTERGERVLITHYADLLKFICVNYFGWDGEKDERGRSMLQYVGTEVIRKRDPSFWVGFTATILKYFYGNWDYVIIPDCRFPNEITTMIDSGFDTVHVRVVRDGFYSPLTEGQRQHPSENALDDTEPDVYLHNNGTLEDLELSIKDLIEEGFYADKS